MNRWRKAVMRGPRVIRNGTPGDHVDRNRKRKRKNRDADNHRLQPSSRECGLVQPASNRGLGRPSHPRLPPALAIPGPIDADWRGANPRRGRQEATSTALPGPPIYPTIRHNCGEALQAARWSCRFSKCRRNNRSSDRLTGEVPLGEAKRLAGSRSAGYQMATARSPHHPARPVRSSGRTAPDVARSRGFPQSNRPAPARASSPIVHRRARRPRLDG